MCWCAVKKLLTHSPHPKTAITIISGTATATDCKFGRNIHRVHPNTSPWKIWEKRERGGIHGMPNFFWVPPIISGMGKATNFKFCTHILSIDRNKSPLQISGKVAKCVVRTLKTFQCTHILGASRGLLCDSSAVLFLQRAVLAMIDSVWPSVTRWYHAKRTPAAIIRSSFPTVNFAAKFQREHGQRGRRIREG